MATQLKIFLVVKNGTGLHIEAINRDSTQIYHDFFLGLWIGELFYTFALTPAKLAFLAFYWRIFRISSIKRPIQIMVAVIVVWSVVRASISYSSLSANAWTNRSLGCGDYMPLYPGSRLLGQDYTGELQHRRSKIFRWLGDTPSGNGPNNTFTPSAIYQEPAN
jgi:hypothetical protein